jgi:hypothetical protein
MLITSAQIKKRGAARLMSEHHEQRVHTEPAVLDIGGELGALILYTGAERCGQEIEVSPRGNDAHRTHTQILERRVNGRTIYAGLYAALPAGDYTIWSDDPTLPNTVKIAAGEVAEVDWRQL